MCFYSVTTVSDVSLLSEACSNTIGVRLYVHHIYCFISTNPIFDPAKGI